MQLLMRRALLILGMAGVAQAQLDHTLVIDPVASQFTWTGNTSIGQIDGVPDNDFELSGTLELRAWEGVGQAIGQARILSGDAVLPYIKGEIPNIIGPPLVTIELVGVRFTVTNQAFPVAANGSFNSSITLIATQGQMIITPLIGNQTVLNLAGLSSDPTAVSGNLDHSGGDLHLDIPVSVAFSFTDPGSGISGDITLDGDLIADYDCSLGANYCVLSPNSVGAGAVMGAAGSASVFTNNMTLSATGCPANQFGLFFYGPDKQQASVGDGTLCVGGSLVRLPVVQTDSLGVGTFSLDLLNLPPGKVIQAGETHNFAFWYRDPTGGPKGSNFSDGYEVSFCL